MEAMLARQDQFGVGLREARGADLRLGRGGEIRMKLPHQPDRIALACAEHAQHAGGTVAVILQLGHERMAQLALARHAFFSRLTPCGGGMSSGTKKSICSGWVGSARYGSKSVAPSPAKKVSSIRKFPVKSFGLLKIA